MAGYSISFRRSVEKDLARIPKRELSRILARIELLGANPRPPGCEKLSGQERYRVRQGRCRIIYSVQDDELTVWVVKVGHRRDAYR